MDQKFVDYLADDVGRRIRSEKIAPRERLQSAHVHRVRGHVIYEKISPASMRPRSKRATFKLFAMLLIVKYMSAHPPHIELNGYFFCNLVVREHMPEIVSRFIYLNEISFTLFAALLFWVFASAASWEAVVRIFCSVLDTP